MKKSLWIIVLHFIMFTQVTVGQTLISGTVLDENDVPVPGANVTVVGFPDSGTITDLNGMYSVEVPDDATSLLFTYIGKIPQEVEIGNKKYIDINFQEDDIDLNEVVVVAYGTTKKSSFTGSVNVIKAKKFEATPEMSFDKALQGDAPGIQVISASGQIGSQATVRIRGVGSLNASSSPLYVVDGVPIESGNLSDIADDYYGTSTTVLSSINPADIESVSVLKDAAASSLYGARAANGVVIITTKKGEPGKTRFKVSASGGFSTQATEPHKVLSADQYFKKYWDYYYKYASDNDYTPAESASFANEYTTYILGVNPYNNEEPFDANGNLSLGTQLNYNTDWKDVIYRIGKSQNYDISAFGGSEKTSFYFSGGYKKAEGIQEFNDFERFSGRVNLRNQVTDFFEFNFKSGFTHTNQNIPPGSGGLANPVIFANEIANIYPLYERDSVGNIQYDNGGNPLYNYDNPIIHDFNPIGIGEKDIYNVLTGRLLSSFGATLTFLKDFSIQTNLGLDYISMDETRFYNPYHGNGASVNGRSSKYAKKDVTWTTTNRLDWKKSFSDVHSIAILLGQEASKSKYDYLSTEAVNFLDDDNANLRASATPSGTDSYFTEKTFTSYFSRLNYDFKKKYYLDLSYRRDASSVFSSKSKWGDFWSVGGTWRISEESFLQNIDWLSDLKIRGSYGTSGNDRIGRYPYQGLYSYGYNYEGNPGMVYSQLANEDLHWEANEIFDVGIEARLFKGLGIEVDYYDRKSDDLIFNTPISMTSGFSGVMANLASMRNSGFEVLINSVNIRNERFSWTTDFNISLNKNEITSLSQEEVINEEKRWRVGTDLFQFYIQDYAGVDPEDGQPMWWMDVVDANGNSTGERTTTKNYPEATRYEKGSALPLFFGGLTNSIEFKGLTFSFLIYYSYGGKIYDYTLATISHSGTEPGTQMSTEMLNSWTPENTNTGVPVFDPHSASYGTASSTRFLFDGSYVRLKNIVLSYSVPNEFLSKIRLSSAKIYVQGENLFTFASHKGLGPEIGLSGTDYNDVPNYKTVTFGISLEF